MSQISPSDLLKSINVPLDDPNFLQKVYDAIVKERHAGQARDADNLVKVCTEEYEDITKRTESTKVQDSAAIRNVLRTRRLANLLINDKGELNQDVLTRVISLVKNHLYYLGPGREADTKRQEHLLKMLTLFQERKDVTTILKQISKPHLNPYADQLIRDTLQLPHNATITDAHARRAALSALLTFLRQNIGSCFATAPGILVHDEQPEQFLSDLNELLSTGRLKRTFGGNEYAVPLSHNWGAGDLRKPVILSKHPPKDLLGIWHSPGLILALEEAKLLVIESSLKEKTALAEKLIEIAFPELASDHASVLTSVEDILKRLLLNHLKLTVEDIEAYENRPKTMVFSNLLMQPVPATLGLGGKGDACAQFQFLFERATSVFKSLADNALLKSWEYTIASFSETKLEFTRWNLYVSLGLGPEESGGIGNCIFEVLKRKLEECNQQIARMQPDYEFLFLQLKQLESRINHASSEKEAQWIRVEYQSRMSEFRTIEDIRDQLHIKAKKFSNLFDILITRYDQLFPVYFQEVYDADLHEVQQGPFDDSPAGFRLLYKHGRSNTAQWTAIKSPEEFVDSLAKFFNVTEGEIAASDMFEGLAQDLSEIVTAVVSHVRSQEFLLSAYQRMAASHHYPIPADPINKWKDLPAKPWAYVSGGTIATLMSCYFRRETKPTEVSRWVENSTELLVFLIDSLKQIPHSQTQEFLVNKEKSLLMHSPTHAFLLKPGFNKFREAWHSEAYTYTWVRDHLVKPMDDFVSQIRLNDSMIFFLIEYLSQIVPSNFKHYFSKVFSTIHGPLKPSDFREHLVLEISRERGLHYNNAPILTEEEIDTVLYELLPLFPRYELMGKIEAVIDRVAPPKSLKTRVEETLHALADFVIRRDILSAQDLYAICQAALCVIYGKTSASDNINSNLATVMQELGFMMPKPILFADSNWSTYAFGFLINPGTERLELWRVGFDGRKGAPMSSWQQWLNGTRKDRLWGIFPKFAEYTGGVERRNGLGIRKH